MRINTERRKEGRGGGRGRMEGYDYFIFLGGEGVGGQSEVDGVGGGRGGSRANRER